MIKTLIISIAFLFVLVFSTFVVLPKYQDLRMMQLIVAEKRAELSLVEEHISHLNYLAKELQKRQDQFATIEAAIPRGPEIPSLLHFLQNACSENGLVLIEVKSFATVPVKKDQQTDSQESKKAVVSSKKELKETQLSLEILGTVDSLLNLILKIEKSSRLIGVRSLALTTPEKGDVFSFKIGIKVYSY